MKKHGRKHEQDTLDQFQAYGEYSYEYAHQASDQDGEEDRPARVQAQPRRAQRIPLEKEPPSTRRHSVFARLVFLLACAVTVLVVLQGVVFRVDKVFVKGNRNKTAEQVVTASGLVKGMNIFAITEEAVRQSMASDHTIELVSMYKEYPSTIHLQIRERTSTAVIQHLGMQYTLDGNGLVMTESSEKVLPEGMLVITGLQIAKIRLGQVLELKDIRQMTTYQTLMRELESQGFAQEVSDINLLNDSSLYLTTVDGLVVRMGGSDYLHAKIMALRTYLNYLRQLGKASGILDISIPEDAKFTPDD